ncbi:MAG: hypothetical protein ACOYBP_02165 [Microbacteriaceae bacterium]
MGSDIWETSDETEFWLAQPGIHEDLEEARADIEAGNVVSAAEVRMRLTDSSGS